MSEHPSTLPRPCEVCGKPTRFSRQWQKFCSTKCRRRHHNLVNPYLKDVVSVSEAARLTNRSASHIRNLIHRHRLLAIRHGGRIFIHRQSLDAL